MNESTLHTSEIDDRNSTIAELKPRPDSNLIPKISIEDLLIARRGMFQKCQQEATATSRQPLCSAAATM